MFAYEILSPAITLMVVVLLSLITWFLPRIFKALETRLSVTLPDSLEAEAMKLAQKAIFFAEEKAHHLLKETGSKIPGIEKLNFAAEFFQKYMSSKIHSYIKGDVKDWITSQLGRMRSASAPLPIQFPMPPLNLEFKNSDRDPGDEDDDDGNPSTPVVQ